MDSSICLSLFSKDTTPFLLFVPLDVYCIKSVPVSLARSSALVAIDSCAVVKGWCAPKATTALVPPLNP